MNARSAPKGAPKIGPGRANHQATTGRLSDRAMVLLRYGDTEDRFGGDGSGVVAPIIFDAVNRGLPPATSAAS